MFFQLLCSTQRVISGQRQKTRQEHHRSPRQGIRRCSWRAKTSVSVLPSDLPQNHLIDRLSAQRLSIIHSAVSMRDVHNFTSGRILNIVAGVSVCQRRTIGRDAPPASHLDCSNFLGITLVAHGRRTVGIDAHTQSYP